MLIGTRSILTVGKYLQFPKMEKCPCKSSQAKCPYLYSCSILSSFLTNSNSNPAEEPLTESAYSDVRKPFRLPFQSSFPSSAVVMPFVDLWGIFLSALHPHYSCHLVHFCVTFIQQLCSHWPSHTDRSESLWFGIPMSLNRYRDRQWNNSNVFNSYRYERKVFKETYVYTSP